MFTKKIHIFFLAMILVFVPISNTSLAAGNEELTKFYYISNEKFLEFLKNPEMDYFDNLSKEQYAVDEQNPDYINETVTGVSGETSVSKRLSIAVRIYDGLIIKDLLEIVRDRNTLKDYLHQKGYDFNIREFCVVAPDAGRFAFVPAFVYVQTDKGRYVLAFESESFVQKENVYDISQFADKYELKPAEVFVNGEKFDCTAYFQNTGVILPLRATFEKLGYTIKWLEYEKAVDFVHPDYGKFRMYLDDVAMIRNLDTGIGKMLQDSYYSVAMNFDGYLYFGGSAILSYLYLTGCQTADIQSDAGKLTVNIRV